MPQADGRVKNRPAIVSREMPPFQDLLVCGVSTQLRQEAKDFDEVISPSDPDFVSSGLIEESLDQARFHSCDSACQDCWFHWFDFTGSASTLVAKVR